MKFTKLIFWLIIFIAIFYLEIPSPLGLAIIVTGMGIVAAGAFILAISRRYSIMLEELVRAILTVIIMLFIASVIHYFGIKAI